MVFECTTAYLALLDEPECTELALREYKMATNMTDQFAALAAITQNTGTITDKVLADFYDKWQYDFLVSLSSIFSFIIKKMNMLQSILCILNDRLLEYFCSL